jgi:glutathione S-transferase
MLERKRVDYRLVYLPPVAVRGILRAMGFPGPTVPAIKLDGRKLQTTRGIARALDEMRPDRPLFPSDPEQRARVEEAERWGDEVLQPVPRRISYARPVRKGARADLAGFFEQSLFGMPPKLAVATAGPLLAGGARVNKATDEAVRADLAALPGLIDRVDELIAEGVIGGEEPNAADFQIAPTVRLLMCFDDLRPLIEGRPAAEQAHRVCPEFPGQIRPVLPAEWLAPLRERQTAEAPREGEGASPPSATA